MSEHLHPDLELDFASLQRFEESLKSPLRRALDTGRMDLLPAPAPDPEAGDPLPRAIATGRAVFDERGGRLVIPLYVSGRPLGLLVAWNVETGQLQSVVTPFLSALVEASLDIVRLRMMAETDPVTGLANEKALDEVLTGALARLTPAPVRGRTALDRQREEKGVSLVGLRPLGMGALLDRYGRRFGDQVLREVARRVREAAGDALCAARSGGDFLLVVEGGAAQARELAGRLRGALAAMDVATPEGGPLTVGGYLGAASLGSRNTEDGHLAAEAAALVKARAQRALDAAERIGGRELLFFGEIVEKAGRLKEILPMDRVVLDLGRVHGLSEGERFGVCELGPEGRRGPVKAELVVVAVAEEEATGEITALCEPTRALRPGDVLTRLDQEAGSGPGAGEEQVVEVGGRKVHLVRDEVTGLAGHRSLKAMFAALCDTGQPFAAVLIRAEGLEGVREVLGRMGADALIRGLSEVAAEEFPAGALLGRFTPDTLGALLPGQDAEAARELALTVVAKAAERTERGFRAGVAAEPCPGFAAGDALDNASKALVHAGFLEMGSVVIFDAVSLNVSGDALFAQGRISEAVAEYERALLLSPSEPNVLNSLGVCHGHLGQMDKAMEYFEKALAASPEDFMAHYNLGYALMARGRLAEASERLERSLALKPDHADTLFQLGRLAQSEGRLGKAVELLTRASEQPDCRKAVHRHLGEALAAAGKPDQAEAAFNRAVKAQPNDAAALASLAELYLQRGANQKIALSLAGRARQLEPGSARHLRVLARALCELNRGGEAVELLRRAVAEHPQDPFMALQLARTEAEQGNLAAARDEYLRALGLEPNLEAAQRGLADLDGLDDQRPEPAGEDAGD